MEEEDAEDQQEENQDDFEGGEERGGEGGEGEDLFLSDVSLRNSQGYKKAWGKNIGWSRKERKDLQVIKTNASILPVKTQ